nr:retrovirus-related Pol polyprotein from transposon TNT 1-94 [Tanacetum cinerariifolium]
MSRDVITVGSTMRIPLLYRGEYSQWRERFMNYLEEQTDGEAMINSIQNGLPNDIYSLIDSNETAKDLWDALERQMCGFEYGEQDRKAAILYDMVTRKTNTDDKKVEKKADEKKRDMSKVKCYNFKKEGHFAKDCKKAKIKDYNYYKTKMLLAKKDKYYDNSTNYALFVNNDDDQEIFHDAIESASENFIENHIDSRKDYNKSEVDHNDSEEKEHLADKLIRKFNHKIAKCQKRIEKANQQTKDLENQNKDLQDKYDVLINQNVILEKIIIDLEDEVVNLLEKKANLKTIESLKSKCFESSETAISKSENQSENDCLEVKKECDKVENPKVIALEMFKLNVSQSVSPISMSKTSFDSKNVESKLKRKRRKRKSSKQNDKQVNNDVLHANRGFVHFSDLDTFSSVRRPKHSGVIWKKKWSSNTSNVDLSSVSHFKLNKDVKRYSRKDLLSCNNSHLGETRSAYVCNDAMNVSCNSRMCDLLDDNNFFIFDDESVRISPVSKMPFRKKPCDSMIVRSKSKLNKSLPRTVHKWLPKLQPLAEPVAKWFPIIFQICLWITDSGCSKYMMGNRALLTNFLEKFLGTVRFGNNDFTVIDGYGDV